jgi:Lon protease-like protein
LFVLPAVLFPGARMPLHIFEPRYRQMAARCLETDKLFGLLYRAGKETGEYSFDEGGVGCVAHIEQFQPLPDGRSLIVVLGLERFSVVDGIESDALYHEALVSDYADDGERMYEMAARRHNSIELFAAALERVRGASRAPSFDTARDVSFQLAALLEVEPAWKQMLLEMQTERARLEAIDTILRATLSDGSNA